MNGVIRHRGERRKHDWYLDERGHIDEWHWVSGYHNGPVCKRCGHRFCVNCEPDGFDAETCVGDWDECPSCGHEVFESYKFCPECGGILIWKG